MCRTRQTIEPKAYILARTGTSVIGAIMTESIVASNAIERELRRAQVGEVIVAGDDAYQAARQVWNGAIDRYPLAVVRPTSTQEVAAAVKVAANAGVPLALRGGGHGLPGFGTCDGGLVIDLNRMKSVTVDEPNRLAVAGPGSTWRIFDEATQRFGLASTGGLVSSTGVAGLTLGGGIGWLTRPFGLACDNLHAAQIVTAEGQIVEANEGLNPDLFWALRGGGGNFGVVTRFDFGLHPVKTVQAGMLFWPIEATREVAHAYLTWSAGLTDQFTTMLALVTAPDIPEIPTQMRGQLAVAIVGCHVGTSDEATQELREIRTLKPAFDHFGETEYADFQQLFDEDLPTGDRYYFTGGFADDLSDDLISVMLDHMRRRPSSRCEIDIHHMGGAVTRVAETDSAFAGRTAQFTFNIMAGWTDPADDEVHQRWARETRTALQPHWRKTGYVNFATDAESQAGISDLYGRQRYERLREVKRRWDPENLFSINQNIRP